MNNTGAVGEFYELIILKAQRLKFTTHLACFVKCENNYFAKPILYRLPWPLGVSAFFLGVRLQR